MVTDFKAKPFQSLDDILEDEISNWATDIADEYTCILDNEIKDLAKRLSERLRDEGFTVRG